MPRYEVMCMTSIFASDVEVAKLMRRVCFNLNKFGGVFRNIENLGVRPLAYRVKGRGAWNYHARFFRLNVQASPLAFKDLHYRLKSNEYILRLMSLKKPLSEPAQHKPAVRRRPQVSEKLLAWTKAHTPLDFLVARTLLQRKLVAAEALAEKKRHHLTTGSALTPGIVQFTEHEDLRNSVSGVQEWPLVPEWLPAMAEDEDTQKKLVAAVDSEHLPIHFVGQSGVHEALLQHPFLAFDAQGNDIEVALAKSSDGTFKLASESKEDPLKGVAQLKFRVEVTDEVDSSDFAYTDYVCDRLPELDQACGTAVWRVTTLGIPHDTDTRLFTEEGAELFPLVEEAERVITALRVADVDANPPSVSPEGKIEGEEGSQQYRERVAEIRDLYLKAARDPKHGLDTFRSSLPDWAVDAVNAYELELEALAEERRSQVPEGGFESFADDALDEYNPQDYGQDGQDYDDYDEEWGDDPVVDQDSGMQTSSLPDVDSMQDPLGNVRKFTEERMALDEMVRNPRGDHDDDFEGGR